MNDGRLPAGLEAAGIIRRVQSSGDFATVLKRGDPDRGSLLLIVTSRGSHVAVLERMLGPSGLYAWNRVPAPQSAESVDVAELLSKRTRFDPDLWAIELDIADAERFIAETTAAG
jgi:hypothetical protein